MPYINQTARRELATTREAETEGELNYQLTQVVMRYVFDHGLSYSTINAIMGALEGAKLEFYRRVAAPYEDDKLVENGDVYGEGE